MLTIAYGASCQTVLNKLSKPLVQMLHFGINNLNWSFFLNLSFFQESYLENLLGTNLATSVMHSLSCFSQSNFWRGKIGCIGISGGIAISYGSVFKVNSWISWKKKGYSLKNKVWTHIEWNWFCTVLFPSLSEVLKSVQVNITSGNLKHNGRLRDGCGWNSKPS